MNVPSPLPGESLASYLHRAAIVNHYSSISYMADLLEISITRMNNNNFRVEELQRISRRFGIAYDRALDMSGSNLRDNLEDYQNILVSKRRVKYCTGCLRHVNHHQVNWTLLPLDICIDHSYKLIEQCNGCNKHIYINELVAGVCSDCGYRYWTAAPQIVEEKTPFYQAQRDLCKRVINQKPIFLPLLSNLEYFSIAHHSFYILESLPSFIESSKVIQYFHNKGNTKQTSDSIGHAWANFYWMYLDFPNNFFNALASFHKHKTNQLKYYLLKKFERMFHDNKFGFIQDAYNTFWLDKLDEGEIRKDFSAFKNNPRLLESRKYIRKDEIRNSYGMCYESVHHLNNQNILSMNLKKRGKKDVYFVEKKSLDEHLQEKAKLITKKEAALILGISTGSVQRLINADLLKPYRITKKSNAKLNRDEVIILLNSCRGAVVSDVEERISLHTALIKYSVCHLTIDRIIRYILNGILEPMSKDQDCNLAGIYFSRDELEMCIRDYVRTEYQEVVGYHLADVMSVLHIGEKKTKRLISEGKLTPRLVRSAGGKKRYFFEKETIDQFLNTN